MIRPMIIQLFIMVHRLIVYFMTIGFIFPYDYLIYYLPLWPIVWLHWQLNNNVCVLTEIEYIIRNNHTKAPSLFDTDGHIYFREFIKLFGIKQMSNNTAHNIVIIIVSLAWLIGYIRYYKLKKNK
jgi:hypothetical protein